MIYLGADHRGYALKEKLKLWLEQLGYQYEDCGALQYDEADDNPIFAEKVAQKVLESAINKGILICGSGIEIAIAANKLDGIRAGTVSDPKQASAAVHDENLNIVALPADFISIEQAEQIVKVFLNEKFSGEERFERRIEEIKKIEENN